MAYDWNKSSKSDPGNSLTPRGKFKRFPPCLTNVCLSANIVATDMNDSNQTKLNPGVNGHRFESSSSTQVKTQSEKENFAPGITDVSENRSIPMLQLYQRIDFPPSYTPLSSFYGEESRLCNDTNALNRKHGIWTEDKSKFIIPRPTKYKPDGFGMHPLSKIIEEIDQKTTYNNTSEKTLKESKMKEEANQIGVWKIRSNHNFRFEVKIPARKEESLYAVKDIRDIHGCKRPIHLVIPYEFQNQVGNPEDKRLQMDLLKACDFVPIQTSKEDGGYVETISGTKDMGGTVNEEMSFGKIRFTDTEYTSGIGGTNDSSDMKKIWYLY